MYGLIVPPGVPPEVAEALEGTHGNPQIDELQTRIYLLEHEDEDDEELLALLPNLTEKMEYVSDRSKWGYLGEKHGRQ